MEEEKNGSDKNVGSIERLIEELTKVRPDELSKDGLKLFEYINEIIDRNKELEEKYYYEKNRARAELDTVYIKARYDEREKWTSKIKEKIEENKGYLEYSNTAYEYTQKEVIEENIKTLEELLEGK